MISEFHFIWSHQNEEKNWQKCAPNFLHCNDISLNANILTHTTHTFTINRQHNSLLRQHRTTMTTGENNPDPSIRHNSTRARVLVWYVKIVYCLFLSLSSFSYILRCFSVPFSVSFSFFTIEDQKTRSSSRRHKRDL
jgi:hypothetical protein